VATTTHAPQEYVLPAVRPMMIGDGGESDAVAAGPTDGLDEPSVAVREMKPRWEPIEALAGGTVGMRHLAQKWLPQEKHESDKSYRARIDRAILINFLSEAVERAVARPFSKPVTVNGGEGLHVEVGAIIEDADRSGHDLTAFGRLFFREALTYGSAHIIVDVPRAPEGVDATTVAARQLYDIRPYFCLVRGPDLIGWEEDGFGNVIVARVKERHVVRNGWREEMCDHVRVWRAAGKVILDDGIAVERPAGFTLYRKTKTGNGWDIVDGGFITYPGPGLPIVSLVPEPTGPRIGVPPFETSAWLTTTHWCVYADYLNILRFVSIGILLLKGISEDEIGGATVVAANHGIRTLNENADGKYIEHSGAAIQSLERCLSELRQLAAVASMSPLTDVKGVDMASATGRAIDEVKTLCSLQAWARAAEKALDDAFWVAQLWVGADLPDGFGVDIYNDFGLTLRAQQDVQALIQLGAARKIDTRTLLEQVRRRGVLTADADIDEIMDRIQREGPSLGLLGLGNYGALDNGATL